MLKKLFSNRKPGDAPPPASSGNEAPRAAQAHLAAGEAAMPAGALIDMAGVHWNEAAQLDLVHEAFPKYAAAGAAAWKAIPERGDVTCAEAQALYALISHLRPTRIMEVGCGVTTRIIRAALVAQKLPGELIAIDPDPRIDISDAVDAAIAQPIQENPRADFEILRAGEMLILDLTHVIVPGGEVLYLYQYILPHLHEGVIVGVRGVRLPREYDALERREGWTEQALLHQYLLHNPHAQILFAGGWLWEHHRETLVTALGEPRAEKAPGWLWFRVKKS